MQDLCGTMSLEGEWPAHSDRRVSEGPITTRRVSEGPLHFASATPMTGPLLTRRARMAPKKISQKATSQTSSAQPTAIERFPGLRRNVTIHAMSQSFSGHDIETGLLQRVRTWRDLFPPLVLIHALRACGSPIYVGLSLVTVVAASAILTRGNLDVARVTDYWWQWFVWPSLVADVTSEFRNRLSSRTAAVEAAFAAAVMLVPLAIIARVGAIYAAGRESDRGIDPFRFVARRSGSLFVAAILPVVCVCGLAVPLMLLALAARVPTAGSWLSELLAVFLVPLVVLIGLIAAGAVPALPIAWSAIAIEKKQDPFDALSRGFEYVYRRPVHTLFYVILCWALAELMTAMARAVAIVAALISTEVYSLGSSGQPLPYVIRLVLAYLPLAVGVVSWAATLGATYLLLRRDANQQEIEDIAVSSLDQRKSELPSLKVDKATSSRD